MPNRTTTWQPQPLTLTYFLYPQPVRAEISVKCQPTNQLSKEQLLYMILKNMHNVSLGCLLCMQMVQVTSTYETVAHCRRRCGGCWGDRFCHIFRRMLPVFA